jgi:hypothetical protein
MDRVLIPNRPFNSFPCWHKLLRLLTTKAALHSELVGYHWWIQTREVFLLLVLTTKLTPI